ncbi:hypothetical protein BKI52_42360 [marine bacterium AO1-C]|nr:hypothetical protein BKI52_42360 [marine bacterium AO1-C]
MTLFKFAHSMIKLTFIFLIFCSSSLIAQKQNLKTRVKESNYIVVAYVLGYQHNGMPPPHSSYINKLRVVKVLKGTINRKQIAVVTGGYIEAPSFTPGQIVVAYLKKIPRQPLYYIPWGTEGVNETNHRGADIYIKRIQEMQQILKIKDTVQQAQATFDWSLRCFEHPATVLEGKLMLMPTFSIEAYRGMPFGQTFGKTPMQLRRIREAALAISRLPQYGADVIGFVGFASQQNDPDVIRYLLHQIQTATPENVYNVLYFTGYLNYLLITTAFLAGKETKLTPLIEQIAEVARRPAKRKRLIRKFTEEILK